MDKRQADVIKIAKGICIFLVVLGHTMIPSIRDNSALIFNIWTVIYLFHMPVFFAVSGILYEVNRDRYEANPAQFIRKKFKLLIIPYISISVVVYLILMILERIPKMAELVGRYVHSVNTVGGVFIEVFTFENHVAQHLWFILVLFFIFVFNIVLRKVNSKILYIITIVAPIFLLPVLKKLFYIPDIPNYFLFELPFFMVGRLIGRSKKILSYVLKDNFSPIAFAILAGLYIAFINETDILLEPIRWIYLFSTRFLGIIMVFSISAWVEKIGKLKTAFICLEKKSYQIYLLHQPFIVSGGAGILYAIGVPDSVIVFIVTIIGLVIPLMIDAILAKSKPYHTLILGGRVN